MEVIKKSFERPSVHLRPSAAYGSDRGGMPYKKKSEEQFAALVHAEECIRMIRTGTQNITIECIYEMIHKTVQQKKFLQGTVS